MLDQSNGYEAIARDFIRARRDIGASVVREWARDLPRGAAVLDLGCGHGVPISQALIEEGFEVHGIDASPTLVAAFRERFPDAPVQCSPVEESDFFESTFDGIVAWGLMFLLAPATQRLVVRKAARALNEGGRFLFTSPREVCSWPDAMTELRSVSLGFDAYAGMLAAEGLILSGTCLDAGDNHYYLSSKSPVISPSTPPSALGELPAES